MSDEHSLGHVDFTFEYDGHGWATARITDAVSYYMYPSYVLSDPMFALMHALVDVLRYGGEARCVWEYEPAQDCWILQRDGDRLDIKILGVRDGFSYPGWPDSHGELRFATTCDLWKFAAKVRLAASRLPDLTHEQDRHQPAWVRESAEYRALCEFLEERKRMTKHTRTSSRS